ncbi:hypothetical protein DRN58_05370 [Thermococci archaeon]|nr:MAG: hypothetical protein DRN58_05370 [Thermococci archaeon]
MVNKMNRFAKDTTITLATRTSSLLINISASIIIARVLGPEDKGIYSLAILLPTLVFTLFNLGISPSTVYHIGKGKYSLEKIFGNNLLLSVLNSSLGILISVIIVIFSQNTFLKDVPLLYLLIAMGIIPVSLIYSYLSSILLGLKEFKKYNLVTLLKSLFFFVFIAVVLIGLRIGVEGAISAEIISSLFVGIIIFVWIKKTAGRPSYLLDRDYTKSLCLYGIKAHVGNILAFLNYRLDMFLVNFFLSPLAVGYYSIAVGIVEKLWLVSQSASTVLFPTIASEKSEERRKRLTPIISRNIFFITIIGATATYFISHWIVVLLYSDAYLKSIKPLQILLPGVISLSLSGVLANDISARGKPLLNSYLSFFALIVNLLLNILLIPQLGINGAALASTISYSAQTIGRVIMYKKISGNSIRETIIIQKTDMKLYLDIISSAIRQIRYIF